MPRNYQPHSAEDLQNWAEVTRVEILIDYRISGDDPDEAPRQCLHEFYTDDCGQLAIRQEAIAYCKLKGWEYCYHETC